MAERPDTGVGYTDDDLDSGEKATETARNGGYGNVAFRLGKVEESFAILHGTFYNEGSGMVSLKRMCDREEGTNHGDGTEKA